MCDDEATAKEYAIKDPKEAIEEYTSTTIDREASIETKDSKVGDLVTKISDTESELATAVSVRSKEAREAQITMIKKLHIRPSVTRKKPRRTTRRP